MGTAAPPLPCLGGDSRELRGGSRRKVRPLLPVNRGGVSLEDRHLITPSLCDGSRMFLLIREFPTSQKRGGNFRGETATPFVLSCYGEFHESLGGG